MASRRRMAVLLLAVAFVVVPLVEIYVLIQVGQAIGGWWTILLLVVASVLGSLLIRHQGARAWRALTTALRSGRMPARELADGALILIGGTLMLTPGFVTDIFGVLLILPFTRPVARRLLTAVVARRLIAAPGASGPLRGAGARGTYGGRGPAVPGGPTGSTGSTGPTGPVVRGEVVDDD